MCVEKKTRLLTCKRPVPIHVSDFPKLVPAGNVPVTTTPSVGRTGAAAVAAGCQSCHRLAGFVKAPAAAAAKRKPKPPTGPS